MGGASWGVRHLVTSVGVDGPSSRELWPVVVVMSVPTALGQWYVRVVVLAVWLPSVLSPVV